MDVCVLSNDLIFFSAVDGVAGAMCHKARQVESLDAIGSPDVLIADFASASVDMADLVAAFDPLRTVVFTPHTRVDVFTGARANGIAHVHRRGALAVELPRILREYVV
ncbi:MAG: hypothetical protein ABI305_01535 [Tepidiformaceae bacterium]